MAILDVSLVTKSLRRLILENVKESPAWKPREAPTISPLPPDKLKAENMGLYLYHMVEDPYLKSQPPASNADAPVPVRYTPMGLILHYLITTDNLVTEDNKMYDAQLLLGLAVKTLHDFPVVTDATKVHGVEIFKEVGIDKTETILRMSMQPLAYNEAVNYWTAGQSPLRLSAYYQVSVVLLEPEEPPTRAGRVLEYGVYSFVTGAPRLTGSENVLTVTIPGTTTSQDILLRPAEVPIGAAVVFTGVDLSSDDTRLIVKFNKWDDAVIADLAWAVSATADRIYATVQQTVGGRTVLPGIYTAKVQTTTTRTAPNGDLKTFTQTSNETPFTITPHITSPIMTPSGTGLVQVQGSLFEHADIEAKDVEVFLGAERLVAGTAGSLNPGEYAVIDATHLELQLPTGVAPGHVPFRLLINGAESPPSWVNIS
jgi:hypothetical protein